MRSAVYALRKAVAQPDRVLRDLAIRARTITSWDRLYRSISGPKRVGAVPLSDESVRAIVRALVARGLVVERRSVAPDDYHEFLAKADYARFPLYMDGGRAPGFHEKGLEHFLAARLVGLGGGRLYRRGQSAFAGG